MKGELVRTWRKDGFTVHLYDLERRDSLGKEEWMHRRYITRKYADKF